MLLAASCRLPGSDYAGSFPMISSHRGTVQCPIVLAVVAIMLPARAQAQLNPDRVYYGIGRTIPMTVRVPEDLKGDAEIRLLAPVTAESKAAAAVVA